MSAAEEVHYRHPIYISGESSTETLVAHLSDLLTTEDNIYRGEFAQRYKIGDVNLERLGPELSRTILAVHKLLFLTGGDQGDVVTAQDFWGNPIYTKLYYGPNIDKADPRFRDYYPVKDAEIQEATSAISSFIQMVRSRAEELGINHYDVDLKTLLGPFQLPEVLSEISDIAWNIVCLGRLDPTFNYMNNLDAISEALGFTTQQTLFMTIVKYDLRINTNLGKKNIREENQKIADLLGVGVLPIPTLGQLSQAYAELKLIDQTILRTRLMQLETEINRQVGVNMISP